MNLYACHWYLKLFCFYLSLVVENDVSPTLDRKSHGPASVVGCIQFSFLITGNGRAERINHPVYDDQVINLKNWIPIPRYEGLAPTSARTRCLRMRGKCAGVLLDRWSTISLVMMIMKAMKTIIISHSKGVVLPLSSQKSTWRGWVGVRVFLRRSIFYDKYPVDISVGKLRYRCWLLWYCSSLNFHFLDWRILNDHLQVKLELPYTVAGERQITGEDSYAKIDRWLAQHHTWHAWSCKR